MIVEFAIYHSDKVLQYFFSIYDI